MNGKLHTRSADQVRAAFRRANLRAQRTRRLLKSCLVAGALVAAVAVGVGAGELAVKFSTAPVGKTFFESTR